MADDFAIKVENVSKSFKLPHEKQNSLKSALINIHKRGYEKQEVLKDIDFEIKKGEFFGIVGRNGSGKSTLLKVLAGIYSTDAGRVHVRGKLTPFIELGVGFNPELTGRENVYLNGALLGFNRKEMDDLYDEIVSFAELSRFMDQKLKNYSSGMQVRLAFSIAIRAQSDILLLDEVLAVGDAIFQQKCFDYFKQLKKTKRTVALVSHDATVLQQYCDRGILIENGEIIASGDIDKVIRRYREILVDREEANIKEPQKEKKQWGSGDAEIARLTTANEKNEAKSIFTQNDKNIHIELECLVRKAIKDPIVGIIIKDETGLELFTSNTNWQEVKTGNLKVGNVITANWLIPNIFNTGTYTISPAVSDSNGVGMYDWREELLAFKVRKAGYTSSKINIEHQLSVRVKK